DGQRIAFVRYSSAERQILVVPAAGGPEQGLALTGPGPPDSGLSWSPDGEHLAFSDRDLAKGPFGIVLLSVASGERRRLTSPPAESSDTHPRFSPDGRWVAFARSTARVEDLYVVPAGGGVPRRVTFDKREIRGLDWTPQGDALVFSSRRGGSYALWRAA